MKQLIWGIAHSNRNSAVLKRRRVFHVETLRNLRSTSPCAHLRALHVLSIICGQSGGIQLLEVGGVFGICNVMPELQELQAPRRSDLACIFCVSGLVMFSQYTSR